MIAAMPVLRIVRFHASRLALAPPRVQAVRNAVAVALILVPLPVQILVRQLARMTAPPTAKEDAKMVAATPVRLPARMTAPQTVKEDAKMVAATPALVHVGMAARPIVLANVREDAAVHVRVVAREDAAVLVRVVATEDAAIHAPEDVPRVVLVVALVVAVRHAQEIALQHVLENVRANVLILAVVDVLAVVPALAPPLVLNIAATTVLVVARLDVKVRVEQVARIPAPKNASFLHGDLTIGDVDGKFKNSDRQLAVRYGKAYHVYCDQRLPASVQILLLGWQERQRADVVGDSQTSHRPYPRPRRGFSPGVGGLGLHRRRAFLGDRVDRPYL